MPDDFYEDDEPIEDVIKAFGDGPHHRTGGRALAGPYWPVYESDPSLPVRVTVESRAFVSVPTFMGLPMHRR